MYINPLAEALGFNTEPVQKSPAEGKPQKSEKAKQGRALELPSIVLADEPQNGAILLDDVARQVRRFVVADDADITAMALWVVFAHTAHDAPCCPNLVFSSAVKACGKSTALDVVSRLVPKPLATSNVSPAALFRTVEMLSPTMIVDEADTMFRNGDELRTLINAGFTRSAATVVRIVGDDLEPRLFSVYCPKAIALIGTLPDTIESRSIVIRMRRRLPNEQIERLRSDRDQGFRPLAQRIARWVNDNKHVILNEEPEIPGSLSDRQADGWRELLRIADVAGGDWPERARNAALELCAKQEDDGDTGVRLLADIQRAFADVPDRTRWPSAALVDALNAMDDAPWAEFGRGKGLSTNRLAKMLARFDIQPKTRRDGAATFKGYTVDLFVDAFGRYLSPNRHIVTNGDNLIQNKELKCYGNVTVTVAKCNIHDETGGNAKDGLDIF